MQLLKSLLLPHFPSGSSINYYNERLFLIGDDANNILVLDVDYNEVDSFTLFGFADKRIPKSEKSDLEASTFLTLNGNEFLLIIGSGSKRHRKKIHVIPYTKLNLNLTQSRVIDNDIFIDRIKAIGIDEVNIEGVAVVGVNLILSNRGNRKNIINHLILTDIGFWEIQDKANLTAIPLHIPTLAGAIPGVSELYYEHQSDMLLITLSSEETNNAYDDGAIGNSYIAWVNAFSTKTQNEFITVDGIVNLAQIDSEFEREKIEGLCVEKIQGDTMILHLISDNDLGESKLFKVAMKLPE